MEKQGKETPTIAELWAKLKANEHWLNDEFFRDNPPLDMKWMRENLRQQLLERAKKVYDPDGYCTEFMVCEGILDSWFCLPNGGRSSAKRQDDITTAKEFTAAYAFWAWELEQRQNEVKQDGN